MPPPFYVSEVDDVARRRRLRHPACAALLRMMSGRTTTWQSHMAARQSGPPGGARRRRVSDNAPWRRGRTTGGGRMRSSEDDAAGSGGVGGVAWGGEETPWLFSVFAGAPSAKAARIDAATSEGCWWIAAPPCAACALAAASLEWCRFFPLPCSPCGEVGVSFSDAESPPWPPLLPFAWCRRGCMLSEAAAAGGGVSGATRRTACGPTRAGTPSTQGGWPAPPPPAAAAAVRSAPAALSAWPPGCDAGAVPSSACGASPACSSRDDWDAGVVGAPPANAADPLPYRRDAEERSFRWRFLAEGHSTTCAATRRSLSDNLQAHNRTGARQRGGGAAHRGARLDAASAQLRAREVEGQLRGAEAFAQRKGQGGRHPP